MRFLACEVLPLRFLASEREQHEARLVLLDAFSPDARVRTTREGRAA